MSLSIWNYINTALFLIFLLGLGLVQSTLWYHFFGSLAGPMLWVGFISYLSLYREPFAGAILIFLSAFFIAPFTAAPTGFIWLIGLVVWFLLPFVRKQIFWSGSSYFILAVGAAAVLVHLTHFVLSWVFDNNPIQSLLLFDRATQILLTLLFAAPIYGLLSYIDLRTLPEPSSEFGGLAS